MRGRGVVLGCAAHTITCWLESVTTWHFLVVAIAGELPSDVVTLVEVDDPLSCFRGDLVRQVRVLLLKRVSCGEEPNLWVTLIAARKAVFARLFLIVASWNRASIMPRACRLLSLASLMEAIRAKCSWSSHFTEIQHFLGLRLLCRRKVIILSRAEHFCDRLGGGATAPLVTTSIIQKALRFKVNPSAD